MSIGADNGNGGGIRVLNATNGSVITITNGTFTESLTNIDWGQAYTCAAWDNVGNLYGASTTRNLWRVWSPPGANTNTTGATAAVLVTFAPTPTKITDITAVPTTSGCATVTITFTGLRALLVSQSYHIVGSPTVNGTYTAVTDAVVSAVGTSGTYHATFTNCSTEFYKIELTTMSGD
jgi:hypothetical protein